MSGEFRAIIDHGAASWRPPPLSNCAPHPLQPIRRTRRDRAAVSVSAPLWCNPTATRRPPGFAAASRSTRRRHRQRTMTYGHLLRAVVVRCSPSNMSRRWTLLLCSKTIRTRRDRRRDRARPSRRRTAGLPSSHRSPFPPPHCPPFSPFYRCPSPPSYRSPIPPPHRSPFARPSRRRIANPCHRGLHNTIAPPKSRHAARALSQTTTWGSPGVFVGISRCVCARARARACVRACARARTHTHSHTHIHTHTHTSRVRRHRHPSGWDGIAPPPPPPPLVPSLAPAAPSAVPLSSATAPRTLLCNARATAHDV